MMKRDPICKMEVREEEALIMEFAVSSTIFALKDAATGSWKSTPKKLHAPVTN